LLQCSKTIENSSWSVPGKETKGEGGGGGGGKKYGTMDPLNIKAVTSD